jgi:hypothetical protein
LRKRVKAGAIDYFSMERARRDERLILRQALRENGGDLSIAAACFS